MNETSEPRKIALHRRTLLLKYPRRAAACFTPENGFNPMVLEDCPTCRGTGMVTEPVEGAYELGECPTCEGDLTTWQVVPYIADADDAEPKPATLGPDGWLTCPGCGRRFTVNDTHRWTGNRHRTCGQKIRLT